MSTSTPASPTLNAPSRPTADVGLATRRRAEWWRLFQRNPLAQVSLVFLVLVLGLAVLAPLIASHDPIKTAVAERLRGPSASHWLGTDDLGRDIYSRMLFGAQLSMQISVLVMLGTTLVGAAVGLLAAYYPRLDGLLMRFMDGLMAFPAILLAIAVMAALGVRTSNVVIALALVFTPVMARVVRGAALTMSQTEFVTAARVQGATDARIITRHILPNCLSPMIVQATFVFAQAVLAEAALSFLGVGAPPPAASWGNIMSDGRNYLNLAPWLTLCPGLAISLSVLALNIVGDTLRDGLDPRLRV